MDNAMRYEELLCRLFKCGQDMDPLQYASARVYYDNIEQIENGKGYELRAGLFSGFRKFQLTHVEGKNKQISDFVIFWEQAEFWIQKIFTSNSTKDMDYIISVLENLLDEIEKNN